MSTRHHFFSFIGAFAMSTQPITADDKAIPFVQKLIAILWPSFLTAIPVTALVFTLLNPLDIADMLGIHELSALAGYSLGFFFFWLAAALSSILTLYFSRPCHKPGDLKGN
jgi:arginine exporter protein ArgO